MASSLKRHQRTRNGRAAYLSLVQHNLGSAQWDKIILKAEEVQNVRIWNGRNGRYSIRRHVDMHRDAFNDMVRASDNVSYEPPNEHTRVSRLLRSVQASHIASIAAAKTTIEATPLKRDDFELAADFLILNAPANKSMGRDHRISQVTFDDDVDTHDLKTVKVNDRFYTPQEYRELSDKQKHKLKLLREERGQESKKSGKGGGKRNRGKGGATTDKKKFKKMKSDNKKLLQRISALETKISHPTEKDDEDSSDSSDSDTAVQFNQRTGKSKKK